MQELVVLVVASVNAILTTVLGVFVKQTRQHPRMGEEEKALFASLQTEIKALRKALEEELKERRYQTRRLDEHLVGHP